MSLAVLADHMASKGRGPDSMLIHMSPREVQGLQALAMAHGGSLTVNPDTGLPEAGFLDKLLPTILGAGLSMIPGVGPLMAAGIVGGIQTVRTGDIGKGLAAGLGAYGGAGLAQGLTTAGASALGSEAALGAGIPADMAFNLTDAGVSTANADIANQAIQQAQPSMFDKLSAGASQAVSSPESLGQFAKANAKNLMYAAGPILADQAVTEKGPQTTTKPGMITPYSFFGGQYVPGQAYQASPTRAADGGLMGLAAGGMAGYGDGDDVPRRTIDGMAQGGMYDFAQRSEPVVRMASGGIAHYAGNTGSVTDSGGWDYSKFDLANYAGKGTVSTQAQVDAARAAQEADNARQRTVTAQRVAAPEQEAAVLNALRIGQGLNTNTGVDASAGTVANANVLTNANANNGLAGLNQNQNLLTNVDTSKPPVNETPAARDARLFQQAGGDWNKAATLRTAEDTALVADPNYWTDKKGLAALDAGASDTTKWYAARGLGFDPIDQVIDNFLVKYKPQLDAMLPKDQEAAMRAALDKEKLNEADVIKATGLTIAQLAAAKRADGSIIVPGKLDEVPVGSLPGGVSGAGNTVVNANGTITTRPDIPGIEDGFTGMKDVRDTYVEGGGSLGYIPYAPQTIEEFNTKYVNPLKGGTKQSYNYLTGKEKYDPIPYTEDGQIAKSYAESVMKLPRASSSKMYIFKNGKFEPNPEYAIPTYDSKGVKSSNLTNADVKTYMDTKPSATDFYTWATTNNLSPEQIALASDRPINEISKLYTGAKALTGDDGKIDQTKVDEKTAADEKANFDATAYLKANQDVMDELNAGKANFGTKADLEAAAWEHYQRYGKPGGRKYTKKAAAGGLMAMARGGMAQQFNLGDYSDGGRLLRGPGDGVSDSIPATIGNKRPARLADGEFVVPARIVSELGNGSTEAGARKLYAMMDRVQAARRGSIGKGKVAKNSRADKYLPA